MSQGTSRSPLTDSQLRATAVPVSGPLTDTELRATAVPVIGPLTDAELRATPVPISVASLPLPSGSATAALQTQPGVDIGDVTINNAAGAAAVNIQDGGNSITVDALVGTPVFSRLSDGAAALVAQKSMALSLPVVIASDQSTVPVSMAAASVLCRSRVATFRTPGRAGTTGQKILSIHNATGSAVTVYITRVSVDMIQTVVKAVTVAPPMIRLWKVTVLPTNGTALTKSKIGGTTTSDASVTVLGDASADGAGSGTTLTATLPAGTILAQEFAPRLITAAGQEAADRIEFEFGSEIKLGALEGVVLFLDYTLATQNPTTDMWLASAEFYEN